MRELLDDFVCVRLVRMNGIDLGQFQFDYDQTWAAVFLHPDGTVFARYGGRSSEGPMALNSVKGLETTMRRVLDAYSAYPGNKADFINKRGPAPKYARVEDIPSKTLREALGKEGRASCVHCHNVYDGRHEALVAENRYDPRQLWKYPLPDNIGVSLDLDSGNRINRVVADSAAAKAGLRDGDVIEQLGGQAIHSIADVQFVLHHLPESASLKAEVNRDGRLIQRTLKLSPGWRETDISWRGSMYGMPPKPRLWIEVLEAGRKSKLGIGSDRMALKVRGVFGAEVGKAGLERGDIIVRSGKREEHLSAAAFHTDIRLNYFRSGSVLNLRVLRGGRPKDIAVRF